MNKVKRTELAVSTIAVLLALLFLYAGMSKFLDYNKSKQEMLNQVFPREVALILTWLVPVTELFITGLFLYRPWRLLGFYASAILLSAFSIYISVTMSGIFGRVPCSCGGILKHMGYWEHLGFNLIFIVMAVLGIALEKQWIEVNRWSHFLRKKGGASKLSN